MLPSLSDALAASEIVAGAKKLLPDAGLVRLTVGTLFGAPTLIATGADVVTADRLSVARAVSVYEPAATLFHDMLYGGALVTPMTIPFCRNSTIVIQPSESLAAALNAMFAGAVKLAPFVGVLSAAVGTALGPFTVIGK